MEGIFIIEKEKVLHEVVIKYKNRKTLKALTALGEYLGFIIVDPEKQGKNNIYHINRIPVERGNPKIDMKVLASISSRVRI